MLVDLPTRKSVFKDIQWSWVRTPSLAKLFSRHLFLYRRLMLFVLNLADCYIECPYNLFFYKNTQNVQNIVSGGIRTHDHKMSLKIDFRVGKYVHHTNLSRISLNGCETILKMMY